MGPAEEIQGKSWQCQAMREKLLREVANAGEDYKLLETKKQQKLND